MFFLVIRAFMPSVHWNTKKKAVTSYAWLMAKLRNVNTVVTVFAFGHQKEKERNAPCHKGCDWKSMLNNTDAGNYS